MEDTPYFSLDVTTSSYELSESRRDKLLELGVIELSPGHTDIYRIAKGRQMRTDDAEYLLDYAGDSEIDQPDQRPHYSCCLVRCEQHVLLVTKNHPDWQVGLLNGIGGQHKPGETPLECAQREWQEETSLPVPVDLTEFMVLEDSRFIVHFFRGTLETTEGTPETNDASEALNWCFMSSLAGVVENLRWLVPMAFSDQYHLTGRVSAMRRRRGEDGVWRPDPAS